MEESELLEKVIQRNYPTKEEISRIQQIYADIQDFFSSKGRDTILAGSSARETFIRGSGDLDIFVLFDKDVSSSELESKGIELGKEVFQKFEGKHHVEYAEHPYVQGEIRGMEVEIVPCHKTEADEDIKSSVDRTPHHTTWIKQNIDDELKQHTVAFKALLSANGLYGSDLETRGFSGYLVELLIIDKEGFWNLIEFLAEINGSERICPGKNDQNFKFDEEFVVVDPVDAERNVASVLSKQNLYRISLLAKELSKKPRICLFEENSVYENEIKKELVDREEIVCLRFPRPEEVSDVVSPQLERTKRKIVNNLREAGFQIINSGTWLGSEHCRILIESNQKVASNKKREGPPLNVNSEYIDSFIESNEKVFVGSDGSLKCLDPVPNRTVRSQIDAFLNSGENGVPDSIDEKLAHYKFGEIMQDDDQWLSYLQSFLQINSPWVR